MEPLVRGGQGRSDRSTEDSGKIYAWVFLAGFVVIVVALLPFFFHR